MRRATYTEADLTKDTEIFLELVQGLGHPDPLVGGQQAGRVIQEATAPTSEPGTIPDTESPDRQALLGKGIDKGIERFGEELVAEHLPNAVKATGKNYNFRSEVRNGGRSCYIYSRNVAGVPRLDPVDRTHGGVFWSRGAP